MASIGFSHGSWIVPDHPSIGFIIGDGIGVDVTPVAMRVIDAAVNKAYHGKRRILWEEILAGEKAMTQVGDPLPRSSLERIRSLRVVLKGPLTTPVGGGFRSLNVTIRQALDLYACVRPVKYFPGVPAPMKHPEKLDVVIFRENTEDVYAGIEWPHDSPEAADLRRFLADHGITVRADAGLGIKPISKYASQRLVRAAITYARERNRRSVTLVHKGNIMKYTEGAFRDWGYEVADELGLAREGEEGTLVIKDRIADAMFQQLLLRPDEYDVIVTTNLNGDYLSDACAAQVGGLGLAPGANSNYDDGIAVFEATHGSAPKYAGQDKVNPGSIILSGVMMLETIGWREAADLITNALSLTIQQKTVTYDLARLMEGAREVSTSVFGSLIIEHL